MLLKSAEIQRLSCMDYFIINIFNPIRINYCNGSDN